MSYVHRFIYNCKQKMNRLSIKCGEITLDEMINAEKTIVKLVQHDYYFNELTELKYGRNVKLSSNLAPLCVFLDSDGIIRVDD